MDKMMIENKIILLENDENLLSYKTYDDIPVYLIAKSYLIYEKVMPKVMNLEVTGNDRRIGLNSFAFLLRAFFHNAVNYRKFKKSKIVLYTVNRDTVINGKYFNRYTDFFAEVFENDTMTIESTPLDWKWSYPRHNQRVMFEGCGRVYSTIMGKLFYKRDLDISKSFISYFNERMMSIFHVSFNSDMCDEMSLYISRKISEMRFYTKWLKRIIPASAQCVIMIGGSYPHFYPINKMLKSKNIITSDIQHGFITRNNPVYCYSEKIAQSQEVKEGSADYFLTYGTWWNGQIHNPSQKVSVGNPYRDYCISRLQKKEQNRILVVGCGANTTQYIDWTIKLTELFPNYSVVYRPHPGEKGETVKIIKEKNLNIELDSIPEIYDSLANSYVVISEISTVLFEAIGICEYVFVMNTDYSRHNLPENPFVVCNNLEDLLYMVGDEKYKTSDTICQGLWMEDGINKYSKFITDVLKNKG